MMSPDPTAQIAALGVGADLLGPGGGRSSLGGRTPGWTSGVRKDQFVLPDGTVVRPLRTPGGYRRFTTEMLQDIAICCRNHHWFSWEKLQASLRELAMASYRDTGEYKIPS